MGGEPLIAGEFLIEEVGPAEGDAPPVPRRD